MKLSAAFSSRRLELEQIVERLARAGGGGRTGFAFDLESRGEERTRVRRVLRRNARRDRLTALEPGTGIEGITVDACPEIDATLPALAGCPHFGAFHCAAAGATEDLPETRHVGHAGVAGQARVPWFRRLARSGLRTRASRPVIVLIPSLTVFAIRHVERCVWESTANEGKGQSPSALCPCHGFFKPSASSMAWFASRSASAFCSRGTCSNVTRPMRWARSRARPCSGFSPSFLTL
jgi:hypothetical protein